MSFSDLPFLTFFPNTSFSVGGDSQLVERDIDRQRLIDISPDREDLFTSGLSIQEPRRVLKINNVLVNGEWLYLHKIQQDVKIRKTSMRTSAFFRDARELQREEREKDRGTNENNIHGRAGRTHSRRISSGSSFNPLAAMTSIENRLLSNMENTLNFEGFPPPRVTTTLKMISPRPLGPTHVLVVVADSQEEKAGSARRRNRGGDYTMTYSSCLELPINDLLFILGCPNLNEKIGQTSYCSPLPRRLTEELPRVGVRVPNIQTFPELVVFLHTYNQAELLRKIVPEWVRDMVHPLTLMNAGTGLELSDGPKLQHTPRGSISSIASQDSAGSKKGKNWFGSMFGGGWASGSDSATSSSSSSMMSGSKSFGQASAMVSLTDIHASSGSGFGGFLSSQTTRTVDAVARDIAYSANRAAIADTNRESIDLIAIQVSLNALRDNLDFVGYFEKSLWNELDIYNEVLVKATGFQAQLSN